MIVTILEIKQYQDAIRKLDKTSVPHLVTYYENEVKRLHTFIYTHVSKKIQDWRKQNGKPN